MAGELLNVSCNIMQCPNCGYTMGHWKSLGLEPRGQGTHHGWGTTVAPQELLNYLLVAEADFKDRQGLRTGLLLL